MNELKHRSTNISLTICQTSCRLPEQAYCLLFVLPDVHKTMSGWELEKSVKGDWKTTTKRRQIFIKVSSRGLAPKTLFFCNLYFHLPVINTTSNVRVRGIDLTCCVLYSEPVACFASRWWTTPFECL